MSELKIMYHIIPSDSFEAEGRYFLENEKYPVYDKGGRSLLCAENGEFLFTTELMNQAIKEWQLRVVENEKSSD